MCILNHELFLFLVFKPIMLAMFLLSLRLDSSFDACKYRVATYFQEKLPKKFPKSAKNVFDNFGEQ